MYSLMKQQFQRDFYKYVCSSLDESYHSICFDGNPCVKIVFCFCFFVFFFFFFSVFGSKKTMSKKKTIFDQHKWYDLFF